MKKLLIAIALIGLHRAFMAEGFPNPYETNR